MPSWKPASDEELDSQIDQGLDRGAAADAAEPRATSARYDEKTDRVIIELHNGCTFAFPPGNAQGLSGARPEALSKVQVVLGGEALEWTDLGVGFTVPGLMAGVFGGKAWMREHFAQSGRKGGSATTEAKRLAARENGKRGGRPKKAAI